MTDLQLKLSDEEKVVLWDKVVGRTDQTTLLSTTYGLYTDAVEKAATDKAVWEIVEWLKSYEVGPQQDRRSTIARNLAPILEAAGIPKPDAT